MKLIELKIRRFKEPVAGILIRCGKQWSIIRLNVVDYVLDGFQFTNQKYVVSENEIKESTMQHRILSIKNRTESILPLDNNILDEYGSLYSYLEKNRILFASRRCNICW